MESLPGAQAKGLSLPDPEGQEHRLRWLRPKVSCCFYEKTSFWSRIPINRGAGGFQPGWPPGAHCIVQCPGGFTHPKGISELQLRHHPGATGAAQLALLPHGQG